MVAGRVGRGPDAGADNGEAGAGRSVEQEVEHALLFGLVLEVGNQVGARNAVPAEAIHRLVRLGEINVDGAPRPARLPAPCPLPKGSGFPQVLAAATTAVPMLFVNRMLAGLHLGKVDGLL